MKMKKDKKVIREAEWLYCCERLSLAAIAKKLQCNVKTIINWRDRYNWNINCISFTDEETNSIIVDICHIKNHELRLSLIGKFTDITNKHLFLLQEDITNILSDICLIKDEDLRLRLSAKINPINQSNNYKYE